MLLKGAISSNNNPQGHDDGGHPDNEVYQGVKMPGMPYFTRVPGCAARLGFTPLRHTYAKQCRKRCTVNSTTGLTA